MEYLAKGRIVGFRQSSGVRHRREDGERAGSDWAYLTPGGHTSALQLGLGRIGSQDRDLHWPGLHQSRQVHHPASQSRLRLRHALRKKFRGQTRSCHFQGSFVEGQFESASSGLSTKRLTWISISYPGFHDFLSDTPPCCPLIPSPYLPLHLSPLIRTYQ
jgi:hypothetical protein